MTKTYHTNIPASYLMMIKENKILMLRRFNTGYADGNYSLPAGHLEAKESFSDCVIREAKEEVGVIIKKEDVKLVCMMQRSMKDSNTLDRIDAFFTVKNWDGNIVNMENEKCDDLSWFDLDDLPENVIPYIKLAIEHMRNRVFYCEYGWE